MLKLSCHVSMSLVLGGTHGGGDKKKEGGNMGLSNQGNKHMAPKQPKLINQRRWKKQQQTQKASHSVDVNVDHETRCPTCWIKTRAMIEIKALPCLLATAD